MRHFVVVGLGSIGRRHATNLAAFDPSARFTFVRRSGQVDEFSRRIGAQVVTSLDEVLEPVDLAVLATPSANHIDALPALIQRGWPLLAEKPVVATLPECDHIETLLTSCRPAQRASGFNLRYLASIRQMKEIIEAGDLGNVVRASFAAGQWLPDWRPGIDYRTSYSADVERGGGVELDLSHEFDLARWFFGDLVVDYARGAHFSELELHANDTSVSVLSPLNGSGPIVTVSLDYVSRQHIRHYEIVGDQGRLEWNIDGTLVLMTPTGRQVLSEDRADFDVASTYVAMIEQMLAPVPAETVGWQPLADGLKSTRLALRVRDEGSVPC